MCHHKQARPTPGHSLKSPAEVDSRAGIEAIKGLIADQNLRFMNQRPQQEELAQLAIGELRCGLVAQGRGAEGFKKRGDSVFLVRSQSMVQTNRRVKSRCHDLSSPGIPAVIGLQIRGDIADASLYLPDTVFGGKIESRNLATPCGIQVSKRQLKQRAFSCAVCSHDNPMLVAAELPIDPAQNFSTLQKGVCFFDPQQRHASILFRSRGLPWTRKPIHWSFTAARQNSR